MSDKLDRRDLSALPMRAYGALRGWVGEERFRRRFKNIGYLFTGNMASAVLAIVAFGLAARALGPEQFGVLALLSSYVRFVEKVMSFQSWQALIKFGTEAMERNEPHMLKGVLRFGLLLDLTTSSIGALVAITFALVAAHSFGWSPETQTMLVFFCTVLFFRLQSMPVALLRLFGRFRFFALESVFNSVLRLVLVAIGFATEQGLWYYVLVWYLMQPMTVATLMFVAWLEARKHAFLKVRAATTREVVARFKGIWGFAWSTNLSITLRSSTMELDTLLVGFFADTASAGLYHIAKRLGRMIMDLGIQVQAVLYPEVTRFWVKGDIDGFEHALKQTVGVLAGLSLIAVIGAVILAEPILRVVAGSEFAAASNLLIVQAIAASVYLVALGVRPALLSTGHQRELLVSTFWSVVLFQVSAIILLPLMGPMGANFAHIISAATWFASIAYSLRRAIAEARKNPAALKATGAEPDPLVLE